MKKALSILAVLLLGLVLVACGGSKEKLIVVMTPNATHGFTGQSVTDAREGTKRLAEAAGYKYEVLNSANANEQANQIEQVVAKNPAIVVLWPHDGTLKSAAQVLVDKKIPVIIYDRLLDNFAQLSEVMGDNEEIGKQTGLYFNNYFKTRIDAGEEINYIEFKGDNSSVPQQRSNGFASTINAKFKKLGEWSTDWQKAKGQEFMEAFMQTENFKKLDAIFTHDAEVALGVLAALEGYSGTHKVKLVSAVSEPKQLLDKIKHYGDKGIDVVTYTFNPNMVVEAIQLAIDHLDGKTIPELYLIETKAIDKTNYTQFTGWGN